MVVSRFQTWMDRIAYYAMTWFLLPGMMSSLLLMSVASLGGLTHKMLLEAPIWMITVIAFALIGYVYYFRRGYRRYFYVVFVAPTALGMILFTAGIVVTLIHGVPNHR